jgi:hypothetical protein
VAPPEQLILAVTQRLKQLEIEQRGGYAAMRASDRWVGERCLGVALFGG